MTRRVAPKPKRCFALFDANGDMTIISERRAYFDDFHPNPGERLYAVRVIPVRILPLKKKGKANG